MATSELCLSDPVSGKKQDPLGRSKEIGALRKQMETALGIQNVYVDLAPELKKELDNATGYKDFRRIENERQLEAIKAISGGYIFNDNVRVEGVEITKDGTPRLITMSHFDAMLKATTVFLAAMNMQNKMWGLYAPPPSEKDPDGGGGGDANSHFKRMSMMAQEMQRIAKREALPAHIVKAKVIENGQ